MLQGALYQFVAFIILFMSKIYSKLFNISRNERNVKAITITRSRMI